MVFGLRRLRQPILGTEFCGTVAALGPGATRFKAGDEVVGFAGSGMRCHTEYRVMPEGAALVRKPANLSDPEAAALCFRGTTALHYLRDRARVQPDEAVLILGDAGAVGSAAVQLARHFGANVSTTNSAANLDLLRSLGAAHRFDYRVHNFTGAAARYDVVMDTVGAGTFAEARKALRPGGRYLAIAADLRGMLAGLRRGRRGSDN